MLQKDGPSAIVVRVVKDNARQAFSSLGEPANRENREKEFNAVRFIHDDKTRRSKFRSKCFELFFRVHSRRRERHNLLAFLHECLPFNIVSKVHCFI